MAHRTVNQLSIGIDLGDRYSQLYVLDRATGEVVEEGRIRTTRTAFEQRFAEMPRARVALEVGTHSPWVSRLLTAAGHDVKVANAYKLRLIYENDSKSDRVDAEYLARLAAVDPKLLHPLEHRKEEHQATRAVLIARDRLVACRTKLINSIRGTVKSFGERLPRTDASVFFKKVSDHVPQELRSAVKPLLETLAFMERRIRSFDAEIKRLGTEVYPETRALRQVKGVGPITSLNYVVTISNPHDFAKSRNVGSYLGMRPRQKSSGRADPELRISKAGDGMLRRHLVQSAQYMLGPFGDDCDLKRWGLRLAARGGKKAKKKAIVAVARKLAVLLHRLWITGQTYEPLRKTLKAEAKAAAV